MRGANQIFFAPLHRGVRNPLPPLPLAGLFFCPGWQHGELPGCMALLRFLANPLHWLRMGKAVPYTVPGTPDASPKFRITEAAPSGNLFDSEAPPHYNEPILFKILRF